VTALCNLIVSVCMCLGLQVIIKCLKPVRQRKIKREIKILQVQPPPVPVCVFVHKAACLPARLLLGQRVPPFYAPFSLPLAPLLTPSPTPCHVLLCSVVQNLRGGPNVIQLLDTVRDPGSKTPSLGPSLPPSQRQSARRKAMPQSHTTELCWGMCTCWCALCGPDGPA
jgi:hypothetical protein